MRRVFSFLGDELRAGGPMFVSGKYAAKRGHRQSQAGGSPGKSIQPPSGKHPSAGREDGSVHPNSPKAHDRPGDRPKPESFKEEQKGKGGGGGT